jgi:hypothetical protein
MKPGGLLQSLSIPK